MKAYPSLSGALREEWGLVAFTTLLPAAVGMALIAVLASSPPAARLAVVATAALGLLLSVGHLARPLRAPFSIRHWERSWLSREILTAVTFFLLSLLWFVMGQLDDRGAPFVGIVSLAAGAFLIFVIGRAYTVWARPAWDGPEVFAELAAVVLVAGIPAGELVVSPAGPPAWLGFAGVGGILLGLALDLWATDHRIQRLGRISTDRPGARESLAQSLRLRPYTRLMLALAVIAALAGVITVTAGIEGIGWSLALVAGLLSQLLSRTLFYALPVPVRYVAAIRSGVHPVPQS